MVHIYLIKCIKNDRVLICDSQLKPSWVAIARTLRQKRYKNSALQLDWDKFGGESFKMESLERPKNSNRLKRKIHYIEEFFSGDPQYGYNVNKQTA